LQQLAAYRHDTMYSTAVLLAHFNMFCTARCVDLPEEGVVTAEKCVPCAHVLVCARNTNWARVQGIVCDFVLTSRSPKYCD